MEKRDLTLGEYGSCLKSLQCLGEILMQQCTVPDTQTFSKYSMSGNKDKAILVDPDNYWSLTESKTVSFITKERLPQFGGV